MGVGVYSSDFNGSGGTFLVSGPLASQEDYEEFRANQLESGEDSDFVMDYSDWSQDQYNDFNQELIVTLERAGQALGLSVEPRKPGSYGLVSAEFDREFTRIMECPFLEVGWRSWEHDFVIGVGGSGNWPDWMGSPDAYADEIIQETGRPAGTAAELYGKLAKNVQEYMKLSLLESGMECRYRTSGYTTGSYAVPDDIAAQKELIKGEITQGLQTLAMPREEALATASKEDRIEVARHLAGENFVDIRPKVIAFDADEQAAVLYDLRDLDEAEAVIALPQEVLDSLKSLGYSKGLNAFPRNSDTENFLATLQRKRDTRLILTADEVAAATAEDCVVGQSFVLSEREPEGVRMG